MRVKTLILFLIFLFILSVSKAQEIRVGVKEILRINLTAFNYTKTSYVFCTKQEVFNTGSVGYKARARLDVFNDSGIIFTGWSKEKTFAPGIRDTLETCWFDPNASGKFFGRMRIYYANEILEKERFEFNKVKRASEDVFLIEDFRVYDNYVKFSIKPLKTVENVIVFPSNYPLGWIFEQKKIDRIEKNDRISVELPYNANFWLNHTIKINVVAENGKYYSSKTFALQKERGIMKYINMLIDYLKVVFDL